MIRKLALAALAAGLLASPALAADKLKVEISKGCSFEIALRPVGVVSRPTLSTE